MIDNQASFFTSEVIIDETDNKSVKIDYYTHQDSERIQFTFAGNSLVTPLQAKGKSQRSYTLGFGDESIIITIFLTVHWLNLTSSLPGDVSTSRFQWSDVADHPDNNHNKQS